MSSSRFACKRQIYRSARSSTAHAIKAHLTIVFTAIVVERYLYAVAGRSKKRIITTLKPIIDTTIAIAGNAVADADAVSAYATDIRDALKPPG